MDCIISTYFTLQNDPQSKKVWENDNFNYIKNFYNSLVKLNLNGYILVDNVTDAFIEKYQTDKIKIIRVDATGLNVIDIRWKLYYDFLLKNEHIENVFFTDISDVIVLRNPFYFIRKDKVYCGDQISTYASSKWMMDRFNMFTIPELIEGYDTYKNKPLLNAGVLGGNREFMLDICKKMANLLEIQNISTLTVDMITFNHILYIYYGDRIVHGLPVNTVLFREDINNKIAWFKHK